MWFIAKAYRFNIDFKSIQFRWIQYSSLSAETVLTEVASHQFDVISIQFDRIQLNWINPIHYNSGRIDFKSIRFTSTSIRFRCGLRIDPTFSVRPYCAEFHDIEKGRGDVRQNFMIWGITMKCTIQNLRIKGRMRTCVVQIFTTYGRPERGIQNVMIWGRIRKCDIQRRVRRQSCVLGVAGWLKSKKPRINNPCFEIFVLVPTNETAKCNPLFILCVSWIVYPQQTQNPNAIVCWLWVSGSQIKKTNKNIKGEQPNTTN